MLKAVIAGFLNFFFIEHVVLNALFTVFAFFWDWWMPGPKDAQLTRISGAEYWRYWVEWVIGVIIALIAKAVLLHVYRPRLWVRDAKETMLVAQRTGAALLLFLTLFFYRMHVSDPAHALGAPFASGLLMSMAAIVVVALILYIAWYMLGTIEQPADCTIYTSREVATMVLVPLIIFVDLVGFEHGHWLGLILPGGLLAMFVVGKTLNVIKSRR